VSAAFGAHNRIEPFLADVLEPLGPKRPRSPGGPGFIGFAFGLKPLTTSKSGPSVSQMAAGGRLEQERCHGDDGEVELRGEDELGIREDLLLWSGISARWRRQ
jgi:hypothetical protein